jgi:mannose-1-phosphate guanylyltransferase
MEEVDCTMTLYPVIMAGGSGTRFWPLSRKKRPKQFLPLTSDQPLITETGERLGRLARREDLFVVCGKLHAAAVRRTVKGLKPRQVLVEPTARNTAPAIGLAALHVARKDPKGVMLVLPSDHHVERPEAFREALRAAAERAESGALVTLGIQPTRPETGYGYLRVGEPLGEKARRVAAFVEKPDATTAERYVTSGEYLWNGGIFVFRADRILEEVRQHLPELSQGLEEIRKVLGKPAETRTLARVFPRLPSISIDYGVMERAQTIELIPLDCGWSDVGSFAALPEVRSQDAHGNVVSGKGVVLVDCERCVVVAQGRPLALVGLRDMVAVDAGDAVLVLPKQRNQDVREVVAALGKDPKLSRFL